RSHAKIRALVEQAMATLKSWRLLRKLRCSTTDDEDPQEGRFVRRRGDCSVARSARGGNPAG
ncbi:hypothetical protein AB0A91_33405, partial [Streptomyces sp. NPDC042207]